MKPVIKNNDPIVVNEHKGLKFMSALTMALPMLLGTGEKVFADTGYKYHDSLPSSVVFPQSANKTKTYVSFDAYTKLGGGEVKSEPGVADQWTDQYGDQMYCTEPLLYTPTGKYNQTYEGPATMGQIAILRSGWPAVSSQELGCGNDTQAAFYATQLAVWMETSADAWKYPNSPNHKTWIEQNGIHWTSPDGSASQAETNMVKQAYEKIRANANKIRGQVAASTISVKDVSQAKETDAGGMQKTYQAVTHNENGKSNQIEVQLKVSAASVPGTTKVIQDGKVIGQANADGSGNVNFTANIQSNKDFTIETPPATTNSKVNLQVSTDKAYILKGLGVPGNESKKEQSSISLIALKTNPISAQASYNVQASLIQFHIHKSDNRDSNGTGTGNALSGVTFKLYKANPQVKNSTGIGDYVGTYTTDQNGNFKTDKVKYGYYVLVEESAPKNIKVDKTPRAIDASQAALANQNNRFDIDMGTITNEYNDVNVSSEATNVEDGSKKVQPITGPVKINEKLHFSHLQSTAPYKVHAWLVDKSNGQPITINGKKIEVEKTFTSKSQDDKADGIEQDVDLQLTIPDASSLAGKSVVAFAEGEETEKTTNGKKYTFEHKDINDAEETVQFTKPTLHTQAVNKETGKNELQPTSGETITDTIKYTDLIPGKTYTVKGIVMDKQTGKAVMNNGKKVTFEKTFTPTSANGEIKSDVTFDAHHYYNRDLVVYEKLYYNDYNLVNHSDINDTSQTVHVTHPQMHTTLSHNAQKLVSASKNNTADDIIRYTDLIPGKEYTIRGKLMDQVTGLPITNDGVPVVATARFTPTTKNGTVTVTFKFNGKPYVGHTLVAFETLYDNGRVVMEHADLDDASESIVIDHEKKDTIVVLPTPHNDVIINNNNNNNNNNSSNNNSNSVNSTNNNSNNGINNGNNQNIVKLNTPSSLVARKVVLPTAAANPVKTPIAVNNSTLPQTGASSDVLEKILGIGLVTVTAGAAVEYVRRHDAVGVK
ncbi:VaFE repeat-containing surface-anchored protein [uncultured Lactobacillus sp.]|uniref:VaFE repeat-containing surface-anchored protein n=1 Tax=uncultured Lactobacillus sp. TaxID=153152 RepID=UPI00262C8A58|nr:VaFE repeat-containing surface-anchored protein [uncultured Lactobacillus sp.]